MNILRHLMLLLIVVSGMTLESCKSPVGSDEEITVEQLREKMDENEPMVLLDVRTPREYADGHISGAVNINVNDPSFKDKVAGLDKEQTYYIYCRSGKRSAKATEIMMAEGFTASNTKGGIMAWQKKGYNVTK